MTLSDRERQLLDQMARRIEEQDPDLASALKAWAEPPASDDALRCAPALVRWNQRFQKSRRAPLLTAVAVGLLFVVGQLIAGANAPAPVPDGQTEVARSTLEFTPL